MVKRLLSIVCVALLVSAWPLAAQEGGKKGKKGKEAQAAADAAAAAAEEQDVMSAGTFSGLTLRGIGPAIASGRIGDLAVDPTDPDTWYVAVASGGVWKTTNHGTTFTPIFDDQGSYSIGCVTIDPNDPLTVWVGTGENNSQRSVGYGDGVYKSVDGGRTWKNVGLGDSQHVGKILVDPRNSNVVYVAAQGPLWSPGGDRGLYKTTDGGATWTKVLEISENTGVSDVAFDPRNPDVLYASAYQRRRRQWTLIDGGPESGIHKSTDGGATWTELSQGLPMVDMGRIGLAVAPTRPDTVYAIVEAAGEEGGFFRSQDAGSSWEKRSGYVASSPQYYQEIFVDPHDADRVYSMDVFMQVTEDGGATWKAAGESAKHVDNHALWIDPADPDHLLNGNDGGVYESWDRAKTWHFKANLPVTQFYKIAIDDDPPFYHVYGGTQDNFTLGGPVRTPTTQGITNREWFVVLAGDGFEPQVEPGNPNIVYAQWQYGNLARFDRATGEALDIQPQEAPDDPPNRFNWDSPVLISPHSPTRLFFASQRVFQSDDRGDHWRAISGDLTRNLNRNELPVMGRIWGVDTVAKNASTSFFGNVVALSESPLVPGLLYAGTDDGLIQVTEDGGGTWRPTDDFPGVPKMSYVDEVIASKHDPDTVYAAFNNHKSGDFSPYVFKSTDRGRTWTSITGDLPERGSVYSLIQDHEMPELLFAGTEFGLYFSRDGGGRWIELSGGLPTIAVRDLEIQPAEDDLVVGTFGRGIYVLDDYGPLRRADRALLEQEATLFPVPRTVLYVPSSPLGLPGQSFQGASFYTAPNPPFGAVFTYYLDEGYKTLEERRQEAEKKQLEEVGNVFYPSWEDLRAEDREAPPRVILTVEDEEGNVVRRLTGPIAKGFHRVAWDLRYPTAEPVSLEAQPTDNPFFQPPVGPLVAPGTFRVSMAVETLGEITPLGEAQTFEAEPLGLSTLPAADRLEALAFQREVARLQRALLGAAEAADEAKTRISHLQKAVLETPGADPSLHQELRALEEGLLDLEIDLFGDRTIAARNEPVPPGLEGRIQRIVGGLWSVTSAPTGTQRESYQAAASKLAEILPRLRALIEEDLVGIERRLEEVEAPWTPGRGVPAWEGSGVP